MKTLTPYQYKVRGHLMDLTAECDEIGKEAVAVKVARLARSSALTDALQAMHNAGESHIAREIVSMWRF